jgi:hypothetical protein
VGGLDVDVAIELVLLDPGQNGFVLLDRRFGFFTTLDELAQNAASRHEALRVQGAHYPYLILECLTGDVGT